MKKHVLFLLPESNFLKLVIIILFENTKYHKNW